MLPRVELAADALKGVINATSRNAIAAARAKNLPDTLIFLFKYCINYSTNYMLVTPLYHLVQTALSEAK